LSVPPTIVSIVSIVSIVLTGWSTTSFTPTALARWKTASDPVTHASTIAGSVTLATRSSNPGRPSRCPMFSYRPLLRSSRTRTRCPPASSRSQRWLPMKPVPPATRYVVMTILP